ncbi:MAG: DUF2911 domain-containing protein [Chitinophagaceae bacterium]|nr:DUF2911 domain-containing protein [Chitinophagaceae bacterium]
MRKTAYSLLLIAIALTGTFTAGAQTLNVPAPSPTATVNQKFATSSINLVYSRPGVKGRTIYGDLVPYDQVWRTGANAATKIAFGEDVKVEGKDVPAGKYALYTIPGKEQWVIILSKDTTLWGSEGYKSETDFMRFTVKPYTLSHLVESFTIDINSIKPNSCDITLYWEKTGVTFSVTADIDAKIMKQIDEAMKGEKPPYWQAANYYFENGKDINQAYAWVNKAIAERPEAYWMMTAKAKMELKMEKNKEAVATATQAMELAKKENDNSYIQQNEKTIEMAKGKK